MNGDRSVKLSYWERVELVRRWQSSGKPLNECARTTGLNPHRYLETAEAS